MSTIMRGARKFLIRPSIKNFSLLLVSFCLGQGALFLAQTFVISCGDAHLVRDFGLGFSFLILLTLLVDAGSIMSLSRFAALAVSQGAPPEVLWQRYAEVSAVRIAFAGILSFVVLLLPSYLDLGTFSREFIYGALPGLVIWSFNGAGMLDGLKFGGQSGLTTSLVYVLSALSLIYVDLWNPSSPGLLFGVVASISYLITVILQFLILHLKGWTIEFHWPSREGQTSAFVSAISILAGTLPGQLLQRVQFVMAGVYLTTDLAAALIYVKQLTGAVMQIVSFMRRAEFPILVEYSRKNDSGIFCGGWRLQIKSLSLAGCGVFLLASIAVGMLTFGHGPQTIAFTLLLFVIPMITEALGAYGVQILYARGADVHMGLVRSIAVALGCFASWLLAQRLAIVGLMLAELTVHLIIIASSVYYRFRTRIV